ncbi:MAG: hypothetical protein K5905_22100 [Roseibium sp.]|uniref:hypothetical protein n=1 Tax=Roseibium sp. TaxID=1936156 RepID=UPI0026347E5E|nr:hypothetical protein [Roseibium sp.]MCV0428158.1 hypothetical protein [Roseibium sp.]
MSDESEEVPNPPSLVRQTIFEGSPGLWRQALSEAVIATLKAGKTLTIEELIDFLSTAPSNGNVRLHPKPREKAIEILRGFV